MSNSSSMAKPCTHRTVLQCNSNVSYVDSYETAARQNLFKDGYKTTYCETVGKLAKEKTEKEHLDITKHHRGKKPPQGLHYSYLKWEEGRQDWIRSPNSKLNFVRDTWGSQWEIEHSGAQPTPEERFSPSSHSIGVAYQQPPPEMWSPPHVMSETAGARDPSQRRAASAQRHSVSRGNALMLSWPPPGSAPAPLGLEAPAKWSGVPTSKLVMDTNPNVYGRWNRTHSAIPMRDIPRELERETRFVTTKNLEDAAVSKLRGKPEAAWAASAHAKWPETHLHKSTMISGEAPLWMKVHGVRKDVSGRSRSVEPCVRALKAQLGA